jgi:hypothetical protein
MLPISVGRDAVNFFEGADKIGLTVKAAAQCNIKVAFVCLLELFFGNF